MRVVELDPCSDELWDRLVSQKDSDVFHSPAWLRVLGESYGFDLRARVAVDDGGEPVAGIPFCRVDGVKGPRVSSLPFSDYCDPLVDTTGDWDLLVEPLVDPKIPLTLRALHNTIPTGDRRFETTGNAKWHAVVLDEDLDDIWAGLSASARRAVRKAEAEGVEVRQATSRADLRAFFEMHLRVRKYRHGLLAQPYAFFENIYDEFLDRGAGTLLLAESDGKVAGGVLYLQWKDRLYYKFNAWDSGSSTTRPNDAIMWAGIRYAKEAGLSLVDLGLSDADQEGLLRYKRKYAQREGDIVFLRSVSAQPTDAETPFDFVPELVDLLTSESVPDQVTESAGRLLYPLFA